MAPKRRSSSTSSAPKAGAKAKAAVDAKENSRVKIDQETAEMFERYEAEGTRDGALKLKEFADLIRDLNRKKCMIWGEDPGKVIKEEWKKSGGNEKKELKFDDFKAWWLDFSEAVEKEFAAKREGDAAAAAAKKRELDEKYGHDGIWRIKLTELKEAFDQARLKGKTPLVIDNTEGHRTDAFFQYSSAHVLETKKWVMDKAKGASVDDIFEEERRRFFSGAHCFQYGQTVMFRLSNSAPDLKNTFNTEAFPTLALLDAKQVENIIGIENAKNVPTSPFYKMATNEDERSEFESFGAKDGFQVVVVTQFDEADYVGFLDKMVPLELMQPMKPEID